MESLQWDESFLRECVQSRNDCIVYFTGIIGMITPLDLHVDSIIQQRLFGYRIGRRHRRGMGGQPLFWHADIPRMVEAGYRGACLGIHYFPWESERGWRELNRQIDYVDEVVGADERVLRVRRPSDWQRAARKGLLALAPGVEGAHMLAGKLERVERLAERGVAYLTLTHFSKNSAATPSMGRGANENDGLSDFGRRLIDALEESGIVVDLAHVNTPGVLEACERAGRPVLCTHTGVKGVHDHRRNISDAEIEAIADTGGVIGVIFAPIFLAGKLRASTEIVVDHIEYLVERVGGRHVALGSDYDGWLPSIPRDQHDCRDIHRVAELLYARGYPEELVERIFWRNALEVLSGRRG
ncbi:MAG: dipeptidase [Persicimonas sp.]